MRKFLDKKVLVTGAGTGIGYCICRRFAMEGAIVGLNDVVEPLSIKASKKINTEVGKDLVTPYPFDVSEIEDSGSVIKKFSDDHEGLHILVINAGVTNYNSFLNCTPEEFDKTVGVNLRGAYFNAQAGAKAMISRKIPGRIIFMSSVTGIRAHENLSAYSATKAAINMLTKSLALELGKFRITVNAIGAGATLTERTLHDDPDYEENWNQVNPLRRTATVDDIAGSVLFLASPEAQHITGEVLMVDGGWSIYSPLPTNHPQV